MEDVLLHANIVLVRRDQPAADADPRERPLHLLPQQLPPTQGRRFLPAFAVRAGQLDAALNLQPLPQRVAVVALALDETLGPRFWDAVHGRPQVNGIEPWLHQVYLRRRRAAEAGRQRNSLVVDYHHPFPALAALGFLDPAPPNLPGRSCRRRRIRPSGATPVHPGCRGWRAKRRGDGHLKVEHPLTGRGRGVPAGPRLPTADVAQDLQNVPRPRTVRHRLEAAVGRARFFRQPSAEFFPLLVEQLAVGEVDGPLARHGVLAAEATQTPTWQQVNGSRILRWH